MKYSILIANYNNGKFLEEAIQSILNQSYQDWEIVLVDDKSTDSSESVYQNYKNDSRIRIFRNSKNRGCGFTKKRCIEEAKGELCAFLDPDDALTPDALLVMAEAFAKNPDFFLIYSTHYICDSDLKVEAISPNVGSIPYGESQLTFSGPKISHLAVFCREKYLRSGGLDPAHKQSVDQDLYYLLEEQGNVRFINEPLYYYRHHNGSISLNDNVTRGFHNSNKVAWQAYKRRKKGVSYPVPNLSGEVIKGRMLKSHIYFSHSFIRNKQYFKAYKELFEALNYLAYDKNFEVLRTALIPLKKIFF